MLEGYRAEHIDAAIDLVVVGNAISRGNAELEAVLDRGIRYASLPETIRDQWLWDAQSIVIAGTHGKTTTTALAGWLLTAAGADPTVLIGGIARNFGADGASYRVGKGRAFVIEGDEYDSAYFDKTAKFLKYLPDIAVVNNIEFDHADIYRDLDAVRLAFRRLVNLVPRNGLTLLGADSPDAAALAAARAQPRADVRLAGEARVARPSMCASAAARRFASQRRARTSASSRCRLLGEHNVRNALVGDRGRRRSWPRCRAAARGAGGIQGREAAARSRRQRARRHRVRRLRAPSDRGGRNAGGGAPRVARAGASGRSSSRARRRRAGACFRTISRARLPAPTKS